MQMRKGFTLTWKVLRAVVCYDPALRSAYRGVYIYTTKPVNNHGSGMG